MRVLTRSLDDEWLLPPGDDHCVVRQRREFRLGHRIVGGFDLDGDGFQEIAFSSPGFDGASGTDTGEIDVYEAGPEA